MGVSFTCDKQRLVMSRCLSFVLYSVLYMDAYEPKKFTIPALSGISEKTIEVHLGLYAGYVTHVNTHYEKIREVRASGGDTTLLVSALTRRIPFELAGVRNHEHYFGALEGGAAPLSETSSLGSLIQRQFGSFDSFTDAIRHTASVMRGIGWVMVAYDKTREALHVYWIVDHELGTVNLPTVLAIDMWEHSYMLDYLPSEKGSYVDAYLNAVNWSYIEKQFEEIQ